MLFINPLIKSIIKKSIFAGLNFMKSCTENVTSIFMTNYALIEEIFKHHCSDISLKIAALNISGVNGDNPIEFLKLCSAKIDFMEESDQKLIFSSLINTYSEEFINDIKKATKSLSKSFNRSFYSLLCGFLLVKCSSEVQECSLRFRSLFRRLNDILPLLNSFEYAPIAVISSLDNIDIENTVERASVIYKGLVEAGFAGGTNLYGTSLYLTVQGKEPNYHKMRTLYNNLKEYLPLNPFNYINAALLYIYDEDFKDYSVISNIYSRISSSMPDKWFEEQLNSAVSVALYLSAKSQCDGSMNIKKINGISVVNILTTITLISLLITNDKPLNF